MNRAALVLVFALAACSEPTPGEEAMAELDVSMRAQTDMVRRGEGLSEIFDGRCTEDCSGHRAGYLWAIDHPSAGETECDTESASFAEGCRLGMQAVSFQ